MGSVIYAFNPNQYKATALLASAQSNNGGLSVPWVSWAVSRPWQVFQLVVEIVVSHRSRKDYEVVELC